MKRKVFNFSLLASVGLLLFGTVACSNETIKPAIISLSASKLELNVGDTKQIRVSVEKKYASSPVRWFTSDENVAYFRDSSSGWVTAVGAGTATVTASIGGGYADCRIIVTNDGGDPDATRFTLQSSASLKIGETQKLSYSANPTGASIEFTTDNRGVAEVSAAGVVNAVAEGTATITAVATWADKEESITRYCDVTVTEEGGGGETPSGELDIGVDKNLKLSGKLYVGSPDVSKATMTQLLKDFNKLTNSNISFEITKFEDGDGASNFPTGAASGPDLYPFVSDQTMSLARLGALDSVDRKIINTYKSTMLSGATEASYFSTSSFGYPFAADNGVVMFYDKSQVSADQIDTVDKLFSVASSKGKKVGYNLENGFYGAAALHTFNEGKSMFELKTTSTGYQSTSTFNCENGLKGMKLVTKMMSHSAYEKVSKQAPGASLLATIIDVSNVREFKEQMGGNYAVAPVPWIDDNHTERLCTYLGYKFYGVNKASSRKEAAAKVAQFLVSEYAQDYRFKQERTQPTLKSLQSTCSSEQHIAALNAQKASGSTLLLGIFGDEYFNNTGVYLLKLWNDYISDDINPTDAQLSTLLSKLDGSWA